MTAGRRLERRIVVALDASPDARAALEAACELARRSGAEVTCVFVEDEDALDLASQPMTRFVGRAGVPRRVDRADMERSMRHVGGRVAALVREAAGRLQVQATVRTMRGRVVDALLASSTDADVVFVGKGRRGAPAGLSRTPAVALGATRPVFILGEGESIGAPIAVIDDPAEARAVLTAAARIVDSGALRVVALGDGHDVSETVAAIRSALEDMALTVEIEVSPRGAAVFDGIASLRGHTLVVGAGAWQRGAFTELVARLRVPVLVAR